jgi:dTDP-4-dehydrorhamnose reductase
MKILLFGNNGQLGWELARSLAPLGELISVGKGDPGGDLTDREGISARIRSIAPDIIVNAAAYTAVDKAETEIELAHAINGRAPAVMADEARKLGAWLIHYSTDYVFDGSGVTPWSESSPTSPLNIYGKSKLAGEQAVASWEKNLIFRTSWVYGARGQNFVKTILKLAQERESLKVIADQFGAPTGAELIADSTAHAIRAVACRPDLAGTYHLTASGETNWHAYAIHAIEFARRIGIGIKIKFGDIHGIPAAEYSMLAARPHNSRLNTEKFKSAFSLFLPDWKLGLERMIIEELSK